MIFVCLGSRKYGFNRLLVKLDELMAQGAIADEVFAQIGASTYHPVNYRTKRFISPEEFEAYQDQADLIITHGGTGAIIGALKKGKKVLVAPRLAKYGEHIDDHQTQVAEALEAEGFVRSVLEMDDLLEAILSFQQPSAIKPYKKPSQVMGIISDFISARDRAGEG